MAKPLRCYANANVVLQHDNMLPSRWIIIFIMDFVLWGSGRNAGSWNVRLYSVLPSPLVSKLKEMCILAVYCLFPLALQFATTQACFCKDIVFYKNVFTFYVAWKREKVRPNPIWLFRQKRICRNAIWIGFQTTYKCSLKRICKNRISCSSSKYDRISIGFAQKSDLGWQSERGYRLTLTEWSNEPRLFKLQLSKFKLKLPESLEAQSSFLEVLFLIHLNSFKLVYLIFLIYLSI